MHANGLHKSSKPGHLSGNFSDQVYFQAGSKWDLHCAERSACVAAFITEDFPEELRCAIRHQMLLYKVRGAVDEDHQLRDATDAVQVGRGSMKGAKQIYCYPPRGLLALSSRHIPAKPADPRFPVYLGDVTRQENEVAAEQKR